MTDQNKLTEAFKELDYEDEAFGEIEMAHQAYLVAKRQMHKGATL